MQSSGWSTTGCSMSVLENLYPTDLQEFGYVVDNPKAAAEIKRAYWDQMWKWSRLAAICGARRAASS
jgi:hypothetical protein